MIIKCKHDGEEGCVNVTDLDAFIHASADDNVWFYSSALGEPGEERLSAPVRKGDLSDFCIEVR